MHSLVRGSTGSRRQLGPRKSQDGFPSLGTSTAINLQVSTRLAVPVERTSDSNCSSMTTKLSLTERPSHHQTDSEGFVQDVCENRSSTCHWLSFRGNPKFEQPTGSSATHDWLRLRLLACIPVPFSFRLQHGDIRQRLTRPICPTSSWYDRYNRAGRQQLL